LRGAALKLHQQKTSFLLSIKKISSGRLTIPPCCIQREADELADLTLAALAVRLSETLESLISSLECRNERNIILTFKIS
jgi:hypothetical protein